MEGMCLEIRLLQILPWCLLTVHDLVDIIDMLSTKGFALLFPLVTGTSSGANKICWGCQGSRNGCCWQRGTSKYFICISPFPMLPLVFLIQSILKQNTLELMISKKHSLNIKWIQRVAENRRFRFTSNSVAVLWYQISCVSHC